MQWMKQEFRFNIIWEKRIQSCFIAVSEARISSQSKKELFKTWLNLQSKLLYWNSKQRGDQEETLAFLKSFRFCSILFGHSLRFINFLVDV